MRESTHFTVAIFLIPFPIMMFSLISQATPPVEFVDITAQSGIDFRHVDGRSGQKFFVETLGSGLALLDYDMDGYLDIYFVNGRALPGYVGPPPTNALYRNNGDGTFTDVTQTAGVAGDGYGVGCCAADYDNDGYPDLYITNYGPNQLFQPLLVKGIFRV